MTEWECWMRAFGQFWPLCFKFFFAIGWTIFWYYNLEAQMVSVSFYFVSWLEVPSWSILTQIYWGSLVCFSSWSFRKVHRLCNWCPLVSSEWKDCVAKINLWVSQLFVMIIFYCWFSEELDKPSLSVCTFSVQTAPYRVLVLWIQVAAFTGQRAMFTEIIPIWHLRL